MGSRMVWGWGRWRLVLEVFSQDGLSSVLVEQIIDKDGLTVQKTVEVPQLPSRLVVHFMDKVVDMPVARWSMSLLCRCSEVPQVQFIDGVDVPVIMQRRLSLQQ